MATLQVGWVRMSHPDIAGTGDVHQDVFDAIWAARGWQIIESNPPAPVAPPRRSALTAETVDDLPDPSEVTVGTVAVVGTGGAVACYEQSGDAWDPLEVAGAVPSLPFSIVLFDGEEWGLKDPAALWALFVSGAYQFAPPPNDPNQADGDAWLGHRLSEV